MCRKEISMADKQDQLDQAKKDTDHFQSSIARQIQQKEDQLKETKDSLLQMTFDTINRDGVYWGPEKKCTCGSESCGSNLHSTWCDKYEKF